MPTYAWKAKDRSGAPVFREIRPATVQESRDVLLTEGCTDLILQEDDVLSEVNVAMGDKVEFLGEEITANAQDRIHYRTHPPLTVTRIILQGLAQEKGFYIVVLVGLAYCIWRDWLVGSMVFAILLIGWPVFKIGIGLPLLLFQRLADASDWNRWDEMLWLVNTLRFVGRFHFIKIPAAELTRLEANALAGKGRLQEAVALYSRAENQPGVPSWLYKAHLSNIYHNGGDHATALQLNHEAIALKPGAGLYIDLGDRLARYHADPAGARAALDHVDMDLVVDLLKPLVFRLRGIVAWGEGNAAEARRELETALREMEKTPHVPFRTGNIAITKAYLCCVHAKLGDPSAGTRFFHEARPYLVATSETKLLRNCEDALKIKAQDI
jgi:tetratricopeptide (TPR) repeat protein